MELYASSDISLAPYQNPRAYVQIIAPNIKPKANPLKKLYLIVTWAAWFNNAEYLSHSKSSPSNVFTVFIAFNAYSDSAAAKE